MPAEAPGAGAVKPRSPARWTTRHLSAMLQAPATTAPLISDPSACRPVLAGYDVWDMWPVQGEDGHPARTDGHELWMALVAPAEGHPEQRHDRARIRLLSRRPTGWRDLGHAFAPGTSLGSREWSGSALRRPDGTVVVYYTAAGERGEHHTTFGQRVVEATLPESVATASGTALTSHRSVLQAAGPSYLPTDNPEAGPDTIRAFRDPAWFRDPADHSEHLVVAASVPWRAGFMGAVALADRNCGQWELGAPILVADGIHQEIERPHVIVHESRYYLFYSAHRHMFHPPNSGPTGLYGFVGPTLTGPYQPLNTSGLVIANPPERPDQAYAWWVLPDLSVHSFLDYVASDGADVRRASEEAARSAFGGTFAPVLGLAISGSTTTVTSR